VLEVCSKSVPEVSKKPLPEKNLHTKSILTASMPQLVAAKLLYMRFKFAA
jgi:hypothetical protein